MSLFYGDDWFGHIVSGASGGALSSVATIAAVCLAAETAVNLNCVVLFSTRMISLNLWRVVPPRIVCDTDMHGANRVLLHDNNKIIIIKNENTLQL